MAEEAGLRLTTGEASHLREARRRIKLLEEEN
jgi:hypothetical protein